MVTINGYDVTYTHRGSWKASRRVLDEGALIGSRLKFCWHFPFRVAQTRDARAL